MPTSDRRLSDTPATVLALAVGVLAGISLLLTEACVGMLVLMRSGGYSTHAAWGLMIWIGCAMLGVVPLWLATHVLRRAHERFARIAALGRFISGVVAVVLVGTAIVCWVGR